MMRLLPVAKVLHNTGESIASVKEYQEKFESIRVSKKPSAKGHVVWAWKEDSQFVKNHSPTKVLDGTWIKYENDTSKQLEDFYQQWRKNRSGSGKLVDLELGGQRKIRNGNTGLAYQINFETMQQTNKRTKFQRRVYRQEQYRNNTSESLEELPVAPPLRKFKKGQGFLPTFTGQLIQIIKATAGNQWYYGQVIVDSGDKKTSSLPSEGWFPAVLCQVIGQDFAEQVSANTSPLIPAVDLSPPKTWTSAVEGLETVSLTSQEYREVVASFDASSLSNAQGVVKVERVQKLDLWRSYAVKLDGIRTRYTNNPGSLSHNSQDKLEMKWLFHGTEPASVQKIASQGFNRSFAGRRGSSYGKGVYFAAKPDLAAQYARRDANGLRYIFVCRVAVGDWCQGNSNCLTPDPKPGTPSELYDSTVDNVASPKLFVVYHDAQAYPEYVITFK